MNKREYNRNRLFVSAVFITASIFIATACNRQKDVTNPAGDNPIFSLNGQEYPMNPVILDFVERGWKLEEASGWSASYSPAGELSDIYPVGYYLSSGNCQIKVVLDEMKVKAGYDTDLCKITSISLYGENIDSFMINGVELSDISYEEMEDRLGLPGFTEDLDDGIEYGYYFPEKNIEEIHFYFPYSEESVTQIFIIFK